MWKVLLVEDEELVRGFLRANIPWHEHHFEVVGEAADGQEAITIIRELQPDLVIADIIMPMMDGLELLRQSKEEGYAGLFLMLTGVNDFEHAREALEYGAWNYLLKLSLTTDSLIAILNKAKLELEDRSRKRMKSQHLQYHQVMKQIWELAQSDSEPESDAGRFPQEDLPWLRRYLYIVLAFPEQGAAHAFADSFIQQGRTIVYRYLLHGLEHHIVWTDEPQWQPASFGFERPRPYAMGRIESWPEVYRCWTKAYTELHRHWYAGEGIDVRTEDFGILDGSPAIAYATERNLVHLFEEHKADAFSEALDRAWSEMARRRTSLHRVKETAVRLCRLFQPQTNGGQGHLHAISHSINHWALRDRLKQTFLRWIQECLAQKGARTDHPQINQIIQYVHDHYEEPITLESAAKYVAMDKFYVSGLFKKKTGDSFVQYLQKLRVEKAKKLLWETNDSLSAIATRVGYAEDNYLNKIFKRWAGMTPSDYRKSKP